VSEIVAVDFSGSAVITRLFRDLPRLSGFSRFRSRNTPTFLLGSNLIVGRSRRGIHVTAINPTCPLGCIMIAVALRKADMRNVDLSSILNNYIDWFYRAGPHMRRGSGTLETANLPRPAQDPPDITQLTDGARQFLANRLPADFPAPFALSIIESVAYTAARFVSADYANAHLYRAGALRILEAGFPIRSESQRE
jgi:hypothetical protein